MGVKTESYSNILGARSFRALVTAGTSYNHHSFFWSTMASIPYHQQQQHSIRELASGCCYYSTSHTPLKYAVIDHSDAYETAMRGRHGQQLALARLEGLGKDDPPFDPFSEEEQLIQSPEQQRALAAEEEEGDWESDKDKSVVADAGYHDDVGEDDHDDDDDDYLDNEEEDELSWLTAYNPDGSIRRKKSVLAVLRAGYPAGGLFAIVEMAGSQHKVTTDDLIVVNRLRPVDVYKVGSVHTLKDVMLVGSSHHTLVGLPYVGGAEVDIMVEEITQDAKVIVFKKRRRKHSQRKNGFRRDLTLLRVLDIRLPEEYRDYSYVSRDSVDELDTGGTVVATNSSSSNEAQAEPNATRRTKASQFSSSIAA